MKKSIISIALVLCILFAVASPFAVHATEPETFMVPNYQMYQKFMADTYPVLFRDRLYLATLDSLTGLDKCIGAASVLIEEDLSVERCTQLLANMATLMNYQLEEAIVEQATMDTTMTLSDYGFKAADIAAGVVGTDTLKKAANSVMEGIATTMGIANGVLNIAVDTKEELELLVQLEGDYSMQYDFLETVYMYADIPEMKEAAQTLMLTNEQIMLHKLEVFNSTTSSATKFAAHDVFLDQVAEDLLNDPDFFDSNAWLGVKALSTAYSLYSGAKLAFDITLFLGDVMFGVHDIYNRYNEMVAMRDIRQALLSRVEANPALNEEDYDNMERNISLMKMSLYIDARGEYCAYKMITEDGKLAKLFSTTNQKSIEDNYNKSIQLIKNSFENLEILYCEKEWGDISFDVNPYSNILNMYYTGISCNWTNCDGKGQENVGDPDNACYIFWHYEASYSLAEVGYVLFDINNDGQDELIVSPIELATSGQFYDLYTVSDGEIIHTVSAGERDHYWIAEDYSINNYGSGGAFSFGTTNYHLDKSDGTLKINQAVIYDGWKDSEKPYFYATKEYYNSETYERDYDVLKSVSDDEASALLDSFPENMSLVLTPFTEYTLQSHVETETGKLSDLFTYVDMGTSSAALTQSGDLYMWGMNNNGEIGNGTTREQLTPQIIMKNISYVTCNGETTAAIDQEGNLYMWGGNKYGTIGNGTTESVYLPTKILDDVETVELSATNVYALTDNGDLYAWGLNKFGYVGNGIEDGYQLTPYKVMEKIRSIVYVPTCMFAISNNGDLYAWGKNENGQLGTGTTNSQSTPYKVLSNVSSVCGSRYFAGAITTSGDLYMWGKNEYGQLGDGTTSDRLTPVKVLTGVVTAEVNESKNVFAITSNNSLYVWGYNFYGQVGNGTEKAQNKPIKILTDVVYATIASSNVAAITTRNELYIWGDNVFGQIGDGKGGYSSSHQTTPIKVMDNIRYITFPSSRNVLAISMEGNLYSWGEGENGEIGNGETSNQVTPVLVLENVAQTYSQGACMNAVTNDGKLFVWGYNMYGQMGNGSTKNQLTPYEIDISI